MAAELAAREDPEHHVVDPTETEPYEGIPSSSLTERDLHNMNRRYV